MDRRVYYFCGAWCTKRETRLANGQWEKRFCPLTALEVKNADLFNDHFIDENGVEISRETILATFPPEPIVVVGIPKKKG